MSGKKRKIAKAKGLGKKPISPVKPEVKNTESARKGYRNSVFTSSWFTNLIIFALLFTGTMVLYSGVLHIGFFDLDDSGYITDNVLIRSASAENLKRIFTEPYFANFSPIHIFSYLIDYAIAGPDPYIFHLSNNIWAGIVSGFVFLVALALTGNRLMAIASGILFVVHPVHVEAIAWISSRKDLVAAAFLLPSMLAYLKYRKSENNKVGWYCLCLVLFILALGGKLSVATFPAVFVAFDLFIEKRKLIRSLLDKIPFLIAAGLFATVVAAAQPSSGHSPDAFVFFIVLIKNLWLLTGFGDYVIYRLPPVPGSALLQIVGALLLIIVFLSPLLLRKRYPLIVVLIYWMLFAFIPSQVLSFIHPVVDRYLYLPSVASVILVVLLVYAAGKKARIKSRFISYGILSIISLTWLIKTINYLNEWKDPRSVWFGAVARSPEVQAFYGLGVRYQDIADKLGNSPRGTPLTKEDAIRAASVIWKDNPNLSQLIAELEKADHSGETEKQFQKYLHSLAWAAYEEALKRKTDGRVMPNLYFRRGLILFDDGNNDGARKEFYAAIDEAKRHQYADAKEEFIVRSYNALGIVAWREAKYTEALPLFKAAEEEQIRSNGNWVPDLTQNRQRLESIIASQAGQ